MADGSPQAHTTCKGEKNATKGKKRSPRKLAFHTKGRRSPTSQGKPPLPESTPKKIGKKGGPRRHSSGGDESRKAIKKGRIRSTEKKKRERTRFWQKKKSKAGQKNKPKGTLVVRLQGTGVGEKGPERGGGQREA